MDNTTLVDASYVLKFGSNDLKQSFGNVATTESVYQEIIRHNEKVASELKVLPSTEGPSLENFTKITNSLYLYIWNSADNNFEFQLIKNKQRFKAICSRHEVDYQFSMLKKDPHWVLCQYVVEKPDFSLVTASIIDLSSDPKSADKCLGMTIAKVRRDLIKF